MTSLLHNLYFGDNVRVCPFFFLLSLVLTIFSYSAYLINYKFPTRNHIIFCDLFYIKYILKKGNPINCLFFSKNNSEHPHDCFTVTFFIINLIHVVSSLTLTVLQLFFDQTSVYSNYFNYLGLSLFVVAVVAYILVYAMFFDAMQQCWREYLTLSKDEKEKLKKEVKKEWPDFYKKPSNKKTKDNKQHNDN